MLVGDSERAGQYIYGVIRAPAPVRFGTSGIDGIGTDVVTINHGALAMVVSEVASTVIAPTRGNILAHEEVNELVMRRHTLIPAAFGTVIASSAGLFDLLKRHGKLFSRVLGDLDSKVQYSVKAVWNRDDVSRRIEEGDARLRRIAVESRIGSVSKREAARRRYIRVLRSRIQARIARHTDELMAAVQDVVVASKVNRPLGEAVLFNAAFLVSRDRESEFVRRVCELGGRFDDVTLRYGGPWPAYDFVTIPVRLERDG